MKTPNSTHIYRFIALFPHDAVARRLRGLQTRLCRAGLLSARALPVCRYVASTSWPYTETRLRETARVLQRDSNAEFTVYPPSFTARYSETFPYPAIILPTCPEIQSAAIDPSPAWLLAPLPPDYDPVAAATVAAIAVAATTVAAADFSLLDGGATDPTAEATTPDFPIKWRAAYIANLVIEMAPDLRRCRWERGFQAWLPSVKRRREGDCRSDDDRSDHAAVP